MQTRDAVGAGDGKREPGGEKAVSLLVFRLPLSFLRILCLPNLLDMPGQVKIFVGEPAGAVRR